MHAQTSQTTDFHPIRTGDGSFTLRSDALNEQYHSRYGAATESRHVFIDAGLKAVGRREIDLLEVGLGTGLNALLTWIEAERMGITVRYHALEPYPLDMEVLRAIDHPTHIGAAEKRAAYHLMMAVQGDQVIAPGDRFRFSASREDVCRLEGEALYDLVYFDAFAPKKQPELWTGDVFRRLCSAMRPGALLVTYCAKGEVRRAMQRAGLLVERLKGPPGKWEMLRATRPS